MLLDLTIKISFSLLLCIKLAASFDITKEAIADDTDYFKFASHVFKVGSILPIKSPRLFSTEEKQIGLINNDKNLKSKIVEGDIFVRLPNETNTNAKYKQKRNIIADIDPKTGQPTRWPNKVVPYEFDPALPQETIDLVFKAIHHWEKHTCIRFVKYDINKHSSYRCKLLIQPGTICGGFIGYIVTKFEKVHQTRLFLSKECSLGSVIHEFGHIIGFAHEQSRVDRDYHVKLDSARINEGLRDQYTIDDRGQPGYYNVMYDLFSIMHYGAGDGVLKSLDPRRNFLMGQRIGLSFLDIQTANSGYKCAENCPSNLRCRNGGFLIVSCTCYCPDGFTGTSCETVVSNQQYKNYEVDIFGLNTGLDCNFNDGDLCEWQNDKGRGTVEWVANKPGYNGFTDGQKYFQSVAPNFKTGPQNGDRYGSKNNQYIYTNSFTKSVPNANAILTTPKIKVSATTPGCLRFWFHMYQSSSFSIYPLKLGTLSVNLRYPNGVVKRIWSRTGNQGIDWQSASVEVNLEPPYTAVFFETNLKDWNYGDICLDDVQFKPGSCNALKISLWSEWSECVTPVNSCQGVQTRTQKCINNLNEEISCTDFNKQSRSCARENCRVPFYSQWSGWSPCSDTSCEQYKYRIRSCENIDIGPCKGEPIEYALCENTRPCTTSVKKREVSSENNTSTRSYRNEENVDVSSTSKTFQKHILSQNLAIKKNITSNDEKWSEWSPCSSICGIGQQMRRVVCTSLAENSTCDSNKKEVRECLEKICTIGKWSQWSEWSKCRPDKNRCEFKHHQIRYRSCLNETCVGHSSELQFCEMNEPIDILNYCNSTTLPIKTECIFKSHDNKTSDCLVDASLQNNRTKPLNNSGTDTGKAKSERKFNLIDMKKLLSDKNEKTNKTENFGSFLIDFSELKVGDVIKLNIRSNEIEQSLLRSLDTKYCFELYFRNGYLLKENSSQFHLSYLNELNQKYISIDKVNEAYYPYDDGLRSISATLELSQTQSNKIDMLVEISITDSSFKKLHNGSIDIEDVSLKISSLFLSQNECKIPSKKQIGYPKKPLFKPLLKAPNPYINEFFKTNQGGNFSAQSCGGEFLIGYNQKAQITSPNYPAQYPTNIRCNYLVKSPPGTKLFLKVLDLDLEQSPKDQCIDGIEIRYYHLGQPGPVYCGTISTTNQLAIKSYFNFFMVVFRSDWGQTNTRRGFSIEVEALAN